MLSTADGIVETISLQVLSSREQRILELVLHGSSSKSIALEVGVSETHVSKILATTASKLGFRNRTDLVRSVAARAPARVSSLPVALTLAERAVLQRIVEGLSNEAIAAARGCSRTTVANQVSALLRKTGAGSRRGLLVAFCKVAWDECA